MRVQQHLDFIANAVPFQTVFAFREQVVDVAASDARQCAGPNARGDSEFQVPVLRLRCHKVEPFGGEMDIEAGA